LGVDVEVCALGEELDDGLAAVGGRPVNGEAVVVIAAAGELGVCLCDRLMCGYEGVVKSRILNNMTCGDVNRRCVMKTNKLGAYGND